MTDAWCLLPEPEAWRRPERRAFASLAHSLASVPGDSEAVARAERECLESGQVSLAAAAHVLCDLARQSWAVQAGSDGVRVSPPLAGTDAAREKDRVRRQEQIKRDEQLAVPSVRRFVTGMERPREFRGKFVSVFSLMRDGAELRAALENAARQNGPARAAALRAAIDPYVQVVRAGDRCEHTGLLLMDIWRYFRHTWSNQHSSTPGRTFLILVRDRAAPYHPVIGIAALTSAIVQIRERDEWIGWHPRAFLAALAGAPTLQMARWLMQRLDRSLAELYLSDLIQDGLYWPSLWHSPSREAISRLEKEAAARRRDHHRFARQSDFKHSIVNADDPAIWLARAESDLFRSKRCLALAALLRAREALGAFLLPKPSLAGLEQALQDPAGRRAITGILRRAKAESVGTEIADLATCGAIAPYNALLGGKLVSTLAVSPAIVRAYHDKYSGYASEIASGMAGRPIRRRANLVFVGTTSLYGAGSSQYNRIRVPAAVLGGTDDLQFRRLGRSRSFGTSHLSAESVGLLVRLAEQTQTGARVNSIFGEGVNPKLRKVRHGLDLLGWPSDELLQHGRQRIVYGVSLVRNLLPYLVGLESRPEYVYPLDGGDDVTKIVTWWTDRWLSRRIRSGEVLAAVADNCVSRPVRHGARVPLPERDEDS
ncbi:MAG: DUF4338 domain-containing protein [Actinomycetota bacterium]|nr:DUF4338 domain-containing protein [Actinomycetota bacterium]